jgi:lipoyl-dependent peroxiredoxin
MISKGSAVWTGGIKDGAGKVSTESGVLRDVAYTFVSRFENRTGTSPEELIAAAHAACFSMAFSGHLNGAGYAPQSINTTATVTVEKLEFGFGISTVHLDVRAKVPGADNEKFQAAANTAKEGCPVSKVLKAKITMTATLEQ